MKYQLMFISLMALALAACNSSSGGSSNDDGDDGDNNVSNDTVVLSGSEVAMPEQMQLVSPSEGGNAAPADTSSLAANSDYNTARQNTYVELDATRPIGFIDELLCFTNQTQPLQFVGEGAYLAWNNEARCFQDNSEGEEDDGGNNSVSFINVVAQVTQANDTAPLDVRAWIPDFAGDSGEDEGPATILMKGTVTQVPSEANPYGVFTLAYGLLPSLTSPESESIGRGQVSGLGATNGTASFTLYQNESWEDNGQTINCEITATVDYNETTETGVARTGNDCTPERPWEPNAVYGLAVNEDYIHMAVAESNTELDAGTYSSEVCLARNLYSEVVWQYALFDGTTGAEVEINSGMPVKIDYDDNGSYEGWGHVGYWGAWREEGEFEDGETVQEATYDDTVGETYTVRVSPGRLVRMGVESSTLAELAGVQFQSWLGEDQYSIGDVNNNSNTGDFYEMLLEVNNTNDGFMVTGYIEWSENDGEFQETITNLSTPAALVLPSNETLYMWSNQLGGDARFTEGGDSIRFFTRNYIDGSETGTGELFDGADSVTLECFGRCLDTGITLDDVSDTAMESDVFVGDSYSQAQAYSFALADLTLKLSGTNVGFASSVTEDNLQNAQYWQWGLHSGPMITSTAAASASITEEYQIYGAIEDGDITEFYVWETGPFEWMKGLRLVDSNSAIVQFDRPISFKYTHVTSNDRNADDSADGQTFLLEYGGYGNLWGLPWVEDEETGNYFPLIRGIKDGVAMGPSDEYIIKALEIEQKMASAAVGETPDSAAALSFCSDLPLNAPTQAIPTSITEDVFNIGTMPTVADAPSVIDGELVTEDE